MPQYKVMFARFPYGGIECSESTDWLIQTVHKAKTDPRISDVIGRKYNDTPITMTRNRALRHAREIGADYVVFLDSDMCPDIAYPRAKPFWDSSWEFVLAHRDTPCVVCAPYAGPPPHEIPYLFTWRNQQSGNPNADLQLQLMTREEVEYRDGFEEVAAIPTGLVLIDIRTCDYISPPYFDYEWEDPPFNTRKASTEDVYWSRNLSLAGVPLYVNWSAWAGHKKTKIVGKPETLKIDDVRDSFRDGLLRGVRSDEKLIHIGAGQNGTIRPRPQVVSGLRNREAKESGELLQGLR